MQTRNAVLGSLLTVAFVCLFASSPADAQLFRRQRGAFRHFAEKTNRFADHRNSHSQTGRLVDSQPLESRLPKWPFSQGYDRRIHPDADAGAPYPKFIGGFHSSHFSNVGLPSGDLGFRGNGLYWTPW